MRRSLYGVTQRVLVVVYRRFRQSVGPVFSVTLRNNPEELEPHLWSCYSVTLWTRDLITPRPQRPWRMMKWRRQFQISLKLPKRRFVYLLLLLLLRLNQLYNPGWVLACSTIFFQASLSSIFVLQFVIFIARRSASTSSFHLVLGLPRDLLPMGFQFIIALTFLLSSILFTWPYHTMLISEVS